VAAHLKGVGAAFGAALGSAVSKTPVFKLNSFNEVKLPKLNVEGSNPFARFMKQFLKRSVFCFF